MKNRHSRLFTTLFYGPISFLSTKNKPLEHSAFQFVNENLFFALHEWKKTWNTLCHNEKKKPTNNAF